MNNDKTKQKVYNIFDSNDSSVSSFNSYLVAALKRQGIDVIIDKTCTKLEKGRFLGIKLVLVVLSSPFIFSAACLENLVKLHEFLQEKGNVGVPVFYNEGVSILKEQMEMCETLAVLEKSYSVDQVTKWRRALVKTMDLQGHEYNNKLRKQSEFIEMIAQDVFEKLYPTEHIGIHKVLLELENLLCKQPWGLRTLAILGKLGIGKTTLVKAAFRKMSSGYDAYRFIIVSDEKKIELLSNEDFKEIPMEKFDLNNQEPCHRSKRVLIVLDDVRDALDVKDFLSGFARFGPGSLLIITSRDRPVLEECHVNEIYELKGLNNEDSLKLFTRCCFGEDVLDEELRKLAVRDIEHCDGNPSTIRSYAEKKKGKKTAVSFPLQAVQEPSVPCPQVFINFREAELRQNFISFLEPALKTAGINVFVDKNEKRGGDLTALFRRIEESKIALVVFSRRYMESKWCLNELAKIKERVDEEKLVAIPIFFKVKPAELKELLDDAYKISHGNVEAHILKKWKVALECIRSKLGLSLEEKSEEADFIKKIVDEVKQRLGDIPSLEGEGLEMATPFGIEHRIKQVEEKLDFAHCDETRIVGIVGMPGIGKTTLAMALFKKSRQRFVRCVAFMKIRDKWMEFGPNRVRKMFLEDLIQNTSINITDETIHDCFEDILLCNKVFLVLDDVSSKRQIEVLFGNGNWIKKGSRIVITTRDRAIITELDPNPYVVPRLNFGDGLMYFSFYAFEDHICNPEMGEYMKMSREFVDYATGNPLVLRVLGRDLRRKGEAQWRERLNTLAKSPNKSIQDILKISFDELSELEKDAFLDIACFFRSESEYYARSLLDSGDNEPFQAAREITDLSHKFFISISGGSIEMHDILHTFAMELCSLTSCGVNQEKCRLLNGNSIMAALHGKIETKTVRGISLDMSDVPNMPLDRLVFTKMCNLRYLKLYSSTCPRECKGDCKLHFPDGLSFPLEEVRYLDWLKYPLEELPSDFNPKNLVDLRLPYSKIIQVWIVSKDTPKLKWVDLNNSRMLQTLSGFSMAPNLLRLNLEGCTSLVCLSEEMRTMESLVLLNLRGCTSLLHLPKINLCSLRTLILSGCSKLHEFGLISKNLEYLYLDGTAIEDLPPNIVKLQRLIILNLKECRRLGSFPECIGKLKALQELILSGCSNLKSFPNVEENMENFRVLLLDGTSIEEVPKILRGSNSLSFLRRLSLSRNDVISSLGSDISQLYHLKWLDLKYCKNLRSLSTLPPNLQCLDAHDCISLETVTSPLAFLMPMEDIHSMFIFTNCCKLDDAAKNNIASHIRRKCQLISDDYHNGSFVFRALIGTCYPGYEVPPWFSHQAFDSVLEPKLPPHWCDNKFLGLALCAIVSFHDYRDQNNRLLVKCTCEFENLDASCSRFSVPVGGWFEPGNEPRTIESDHVFIGYISWLNIKKLQEEEYKKGCVPTKAKLRFLVTDETGEEIAQCEVVKCGFGLVYEPDDEVSNVVLSTRTRMNGEVSKFISAEDVSDYQGDYQGDTQGDTPTTARIFFDYFKKK